LNLFIQVCQAIQHAHQKGIIHRDVKPSNILVTLHDGIPIPKVIDFGIAKATQGDLTEKTVYTQFQQFIGTPAYMSPEQAEMSGLDVDTRSDIYSLGVLLYELLTGLTPFDAKEVMKAGMDELRRTIRQAEPVRPSNRLSGMAGADSTETAKRRGMETHRLIALLRGDLDWIVMKCLEKDRTRRYETATALAQDVQHHLNNEPISARPPSSMYRARKFVRRNKLAVMATAAIAAAMLLGLGMATAEFFRARAERDRAEVATALASDNFNQAREAVEDLLSVSDERLHDEPGMQPLRMELMKAAIDRYEPFLARPIADPTPRAELARLYVRYGFLMLYSVPPSDQRDATIMAAYEKARTIQEQLLQEHPGDRTFRSDLGWTLIMETWWHHKMPPSPEQTGTRAMRVFREMIDEDPSDPFARDDLAWAIWQCASLHYNAAALTLSNEGLAIEEQLVKEYPDSIEFRRDLSNALQFNQRLAITLSPTPQNAEKALAAFQRILKLRQDVLADLLRDRPEALQPQRPTHSEAHLIYPGIMYTRRDVALAFEFAADTYVLQKDWPNAANIYDQSASIYKELVESSPASATFADELAGEFLSRLIAARHANDRHNVVAWSRDAMEFWKQQADLHKDLPFLRQQADDAASSDARIDQWFAARPPSTQP
jgi:eukaryotic-like serine/threonine-protein kinase